MPGYMARGLSALLILLTLLILLMTAPLAHAGIVSAPVPGSTLARLQGRSIPAVALIGDSRLWDSHNTGGNVEDIRSIGAAYNLMLRTGGRVTFPQALNFAVGSTKSCDLLNSTYTTLNGAGDSLGYGQLANYPNSTPVQALLANRSQIGLVILLTSTNDRTSSYTANWQPGQALNNTDSLSCTYRVLQQLTAAGLPVIVADEMPRGDSSFTSKRLTAPDLNRHFFYSRWVRGLSMPGVYVADTFSTMALASSATGDDIVGLTYDGLHPSQLGWYTAAVPVAAIIDQIVPPNPTVFASNTDVYSSSDNPSGNLIANGMMQGSTAIDSIGSAASITGVKPTSWTVSGSNLGGLTIVGSKVTNASGNTCMQLAVSGTSTSASTPKLEFRQALTLGNLTQGDVLNMQGWVEFDAGTAGVTSAYPSIVLLDTGNSSTIWESRAGGPASSSSPPTTAYGGFLWLDDVTVPSVATLGTSSKARYQIEFTPLAVVTLTVRYCQTGVFKQMVRPTAANDDAAWRMLAQAVVTKAAA